MTLPLLLVGAVAEALAPRLRLSGYAPLRLGPGAGEAEPLQEMDPPPGGREEPAPSELPRAPAASLDSSARGDAGLPAPDGDRATGHPSAGYPAAGTMAPLCAVILSPGEEHRIQALRQRWGALPILLGIPEDSVDGRELTLLCGADDFWLPGLAPSDLLTRLRLHRQILSQAPLPMERLQVADLQVIPSSRQVQRGSRLVSLTAREYQLLLLLLEHRGRVLSRERILERVWPDQQGAGSNVIEVYVRYLRQKLEQAGERRLIHTVRGQGYCLNDGPPSLR